MNNHSLVFEKGMTANKVILILGILFVSFNLRPAITAVGPVVSAIRADLHITNGQAGFITTLPLLSFAVFSFIAPKLGYRFGSEAMIFAGMLALLAGILIRSTGVLSALFIGTALVGVGIALANVLLPSIIKNRYPAKIGLMTGVYTASMSIFAALGSGFTITLADGFQLGWQHSLMFWGILALAALILWYPQLHQSSGNQADVKRKAQAVPGSNIWRSAIAWQVTLFMGFQSFLFYCMIAWLPEILSGAGLPLATAGWLVSIMQLAGIPMAFFIPVLAGRLENQKGLIWLIGALYMAGLSGLLTGGSVALITISVMLIGLGQGSSISLALTLLGLRAANPKESAELSGMAQSLGYAFAATGPVLIGFFLDMTGSPFVPLFIFVGIVIVMVVAGLGAGRNKTIFQV
ncbi:CynX/NimT family MFS transporter [Thalassorhabdus alkalitolerans]|uniref:CynX/NimT family MFS transporter n=1 Tax=Thalassorhabdus alkalitolerans TaxID=2282697 RepID=A0ABW0YGM9_9BACI